MARPTNKNTNLTSYHGYDIETTAEKLIALFPDSYFLENTGEDKTNIDFSLETEDGNVFTVYDWKMFRPISMTETIHFHIGSHSPAISAQAKNELETILNSKQ